MQEQGLHGDLEEEVYESMSSNSSQRQGKENRQYFQPSQETSQKDIVSRQICFPQKPQQMGRLFEIYKKNASKFKRLTSEVEKLEKNILEQMRLKHSRAQYEICLEGIEEVNTDDYKIAEYDEKRAQRANNLNKLSQEYETLKKINKMEVFLMKEANQQKMVELIKNSKEVINYRVVKDHLVILIKQKKRVESNQEQYSGQKHFEDSGIFLQQEEHCEDYYTITIFNLNNLRHWLSPKPSRLQCNEENESEYLQKCKQQAEMYSNMTKNINIFGVLNPVTASYSLKYQFIFVHERGGRNLVYNLLGEVKATITLDKQDRLVMFEALGNELILGTSQGVVRVYKIQPSGSLELAKLFMCYWRVLSQVKCYKAIGFDCLQKILFYSDGGIYQYDLQTNVVSEIKKACKDTTLSEEDKTLENMMQKFIIFEENEGKDLMDKIKEYIKLKGRWMCQYELIDCFNQQTKEKDCKGYHLLLGDRLGFLELLAI